MGSMIHLALGRLELDWGKNRGFNDYSGLFQESDVKDVPYYYVGDPLPEPGPDGRDWSVLTVHKEGLSKPLKQVVDRLNLLGYTERYARREFDYVSRICDSEGNNLTYELLNKALATVNLNALSLDYGEGGEDFGKFFRQEISPRLNLKDIVGDQFSDWNLGYAMENLSPYVVMRLVADNPLARELPVNWQFNDLAENGWAKRSEFVRSLDPSNRFLIVTEGSSDANILRHAFALLHPHIADFFHFVDMQEGYPFTGTGNVFRFVQGLIIISVQNNVVVLYDNDAEGTASYQRTQDLNVPDNMQILKLPDMPAFTNFRTVGPDGLSHGDINGRAAAIECYLDLCKDPLVRWSTFNHKLGIYQGELVNKESYTREFLSQKKRRNDYDYLGIEAVLDMLIATCSSMRESVQISALDDFDNEEDDHDASNDEK